MFSFVASIQFLGAKRYFNSSRCTFVGYYCFYWYPAVISDVRNHLWHVYAYDTLITLKLFMLLVETIVAMRRHCDTIQWRLSSVCALFHRVISFSSFLFLCVLSFSQDCSPETRKISTKSCLRWAPMVKRLRLQSIHFHCIKLCCLLEVNSAVLS